MDGGTSYFMACMLAYHFGGVRGAVPVLWKAYTVRVRHRGTACGISRNGGVG